MVDDPKHSRSTRRFDSDELAKLTKESVGESATFAPDAPEDAVATSRTPTMHDPLTMALLAEVARTSRTVELDPAKIEGARSAAETAADVAPTESDATEPQAHPRIKRR